MQAIPRLLLKLPDESKGPETEVFTQELGLSISAQRQLFLRVMSCHGVSLLEAKELHELKLHADVVQPIVEVRRKVQSEGSVEPGDISQGLGFLEDVSLSVLGFVWGTFFGDSVAEASDVRRLQVVDPYCLQD